ncbi:MAG TPA: hypothetical protein VGQ53_14315 [Chitinophagaceae bacterium]|jgi:hypothetical protein|nr:hypothetical protein [Chitinophagaceae bacterium]
MVRPIDIKSVLSDLESRIVNFAKASFKELVTEATKDGKDLFTKVKEDLSRWLQLLADKQITNAEFETLLLGKRDLIAMRALTQAGLSLVKIDAFKTGLFNLITDTVFSVIKISSL